MMATLLSIEALETDRLYAQRQLAEAQASPWGTARLMWESRLADIEDRIAALHSARSNHASVALIFDGLPVIGTTDIRLDFAAEALDSYQRIISLELAARVSAGLSQRGPLPGANRSRLFIRDLARGSMGFILEEITTEQDEMLSTALKDAVEGTTQLLSSLSEAADEAFGSMLEATHPRVVGAVQRFAKVLHEAHASTRILGDDYRVSLTADDVGRLMQRLSDVEVSEVVESIYGILLGILPESRQFELKSPGDEVPTLRGGISEDLAVKYTADAAFKERLLLKPVRAEIRRTQTMRNGNLLREQRVLVSVEPATTPSAGSG
jgi:hypothetical protein